MKTFMISLLCATALPAAEVKLTGWTHLGPKGFSVNALAETGGESGRYWVVYGRGDQLSESTTPRPLPPIRAAYLEESWARGTAGWTGGLSGKDLVHQQDPAGTSFVRYLGPTEPENRAFPGEPPGLDVNHVDGIGALHLCHYIYAARLGGNPLRTPVGTGLNLGGGRPDFRDAQVRLRIRGNAVKAHDAELTFWAQSDHDPALQLSDRWVRANWAYTGRYLTEALVGGGWREISYVLENDTRRWTYGGNNASQERSDRYAYLNLNQALENLNANFFHLFVYVNGRNPPTGTIDFDSISIAYRNHSLLLPAHGTRLVASPAGSRVPADRLTDGWRHGDDREWHSGPSPRGPQAFVWTFPQPVSLQTLQVHQALRYPARDLAAYVSSDGVSWKPLSRFSLPRQSAVSANHTYHVEDVSAEGVTHFKLEIIAGYDQEGWGLGEVELFGGGMPLASDPAGASLNVDLGSLSPGEEYSYQFVVQGAGGERRSAIGRLRVPVNDHPLIVAVWRRQTAAADMELWARVVPMGHRTIARVEVLRDGIWKRASADHYVGNQMTERDVKFFTTTPLRDLDAAIRIVLDPGTGSQVEGPSCNPKQLILETP